MGDGQWRRPSCSGKRTSDNEREDDCGNRLRGWDDRPARHHSSKALCRRCPCRVIVRAAVPGLAATNVLTVLGPARGVVATSGTAHRGTQIVDPRTSRPVQHLMAVTVTGPSLMWADVYATAAFVRGPDALAWLDCLPDHEAPVVNRSGSIAPPADGHRPSIAESMRILVGDDMLGALLLRITHL